MEAACDFHTALQIILEGRDNSGIPFGISSDDDPDWVEKWTWLEEKFAKKIAELELKMAEGIGSTNIPPQDWPKDYTEISKQINGLETCPEAILRSYALQAQRKNDPKEIVFLMELVRRNQYSTHDLLQLAISIPTATIQDIQQKIELLKTVCLQQEVMRHPNLEKTIGLILRLRQRKRTTLGRYQRNN
ncbi:MAG: hypothetical protein WC846_05555 [Candidatus Gracilibacteria bacterium]|jgi:hypothetical protein